MPSTGRDDDPVRPVREITGDGTLGTSLAGAILMTVTGFIPGSPLVGGALTGYLVRDDRGRGTRAGALAGVWASIPTAVVVVVVFWFSAMFAMASLPFAVAGVFFVALLLLALLYTVGLAAVGGYLGVIAYERGVGRDPPERDRRRTETYDSSDASNRY